MSLPHEKNSPVIVFGGGTGSHTALQIKADVTGREYESLGDIAPANLATALLGALAVGEIDEVQSTIRAHLNPTKIYTPHEKRNAQYKTFLKTYQEAVGLLAEFRSS